MQAYSIYADNRPMKVIYLIVGSLRYRKNVEKAIDNIIDRSQSFWGGRFSPVLVLNSGTLDASQLSFLKTFDPDVIKFIGTLKPTTLRQINLVSHPYHIDQVAIDAEYISVEIDDTRVEYLPTPEWIAKINRTLPNESQIVLFDIKDLKDEDIWRFIVRNFGIIDETYSSSRVLEHAFKLRLKVKDLDSLLEAFDKISNARGIVFPIQLSASPCNLNEIERKNYEDTFHICVGDNVKDIVFSWNNPLTQPQWRRAYINSLWVPKSLARDKKFAKSLGILVRRFSKSFTSWGAEKVIVESHSVKKGTLEKLVKGIDVQGFLRTEILELGNTQTFPEYLNFFTFDILKTGMQYFRLHSEKENIRLDCPLSKDSIKNGGHWMADFYVNKGNEGLYYSNLESWLQLPSHNLLTRSIFPETPSRITNRGLPSCLVQMPFSEPIAQDGNVIKFRMISEDSIFRGIMLSNSKAFQNFTCYNADPRKKLLELEYIRDSEISSSGKYLMGFVGNFQGLSTAERFLSDDYWIEIMNYLSGKGAEKDKNLLEPLTNRIANDIKKGRVSAQDAENLARYLLGLAKSYDLPSVTGASYDIFERSLGKKNAKYQDEKTSPKKRREMKVQAEEEVREEMDDLIELGILLMGFYLRCPSCGFAEWRAIDETSQNLNCRGCNNSYTLSAQHKWSYRINSLVQAGIAKHGLVPVVLALSNLSQRARHFFAFYPSLDVFSPGRQTAFTDIDLLCVVDGRLILGECKESSLGFKTKDFDNMLKVGKALRPAEIFFCAFSGKQTQTIKDKMAEISVELEPLGVKVKWMGADYVPHIDRHY